MDTEEQGPMAIEEQGPMDTEEEADHIDAILSTGMEFDQSIDSGDVQRAIAALIDEEESQAEREEEGRQTDHEEEGEAGGAPEGEAGGEAEGEAGGEAEGEAGANDRTRWYRKPQAGAAAVGRGVSKAAAATGRAAGKAAAATGKTTTTATGRSVAAIRSIAHRTSATGITVAYVLGEGVKPRDAWKLVTTVALLIRLYRQGKIPGKEAKVVAAELAWLVGTYGSEIKGVILVVTAIMVEGVAEGASQSLVKMDMDALGTLASALLQKQELTVISESQISSTVRQILAYGSGGPDGDKTLVLCKCGSRRITADDVMSFHTSMKSQKAARGLLLTPAACEAKAVVTAPKNGSLTLICGAKLERMLRTHHIWPIT